MLGITGAGVIAAERAAFYKIAIKMSEFYGEEFIHEIETNS